MKRKRLYNVSTCIVSVRETGGTDRQTYKHTYTQTHIHTDTQVDKQTGSIVSNTQYQCAYKSAMLIEQHTSGIIWVDAHHRMPSSTLDVCHMWHTIVESVCRVMCTFITIDQCSWLWCDCYIRWWLYVSMTSFNKASFHSTCMDNTVEKVVILWHIVISQLGSWLVVILIVHWA